MHHAVYFINVDIVSKLKLWHRPISSVGCQSETACSAQPCAVNHWPTHSDVVYGSAANYSQLAQLFTSADVMRSMKISYSLPW